MVYSLRKKLDRLARRVDLIQPTGANGQVEALGRELMSRYQPNVSPQVMANPPQVTFSSTAQIPSVVVVSPYNPAVRVRHTDPKVGATGNMVHRLYGVTNPDYPSSLGENHTHGWAVEFATTAEDLELRINGRQQGFRISVNDESVTPYGFYNEGLAYGVADVGGTTFCRMRFTESSAPVAPAWPTSYLRTVQDDRIRWMATDIATSTYLVNDSTWTGASGTTPPSGWAQFGLPTFTVGTHDGVTTALNIVTTATNQNFRRIAATVSGVTHILKFRAKVISGSFQWTSGTGFYTLTTTNSGRWTTHYVPFTAGATELFLNNFSAAGEIWLDEVQLYDVSAAPAVTAWAANTPYTKGTIVSPASYTGFHYQAVVVRPEMKRVLVELSGYLEFAGVGLPPGEFLSQPGRQRRPICAVIGDSYSLGAGSVIPNAPTHNSVLADFGSWPLIMCRELGWDARVNGSGSSGYIANGNGGRFSLRLDELIAHNPEVFVFAGGYNDGASAANVVADEFATLVGRVRAALPSCVIMAIGPWTPEISASQPTLNRLRINKALRDRAQELGVLYIAPIEWPVITGEQTAAGSGNAVQYIATGGVHPTIFGYDALGRWIASQIAFQLAGRPDYIDALRMLDAPTPTGWSTFGTVGQALETHDGVVDARRITVANVTGHNFFRTVLQAGQVGYNARKIRLRFKLKVTSGAVYVGNGTPVIAGRFSFASRVRTRPLNGSWEEQPIPSLPTTSHLYPAFTPVTTPVWTEYEIESTWGATLLSFYSDVTTDANTVYYLKDVTVDVLED